MTLRATDRRPSAPIEDNPQLRRPDRFTPVAVGARSRGGPLESGRSLLELRLGFDLKKSVELRFDRAITFADPHFQAAPVQDVNVAAHVTDHSRLPQFARGDGDSGAARA